MFTEEIIERIADALEAGKSWAAVTSGLKAKGLIGPKMKINDVTKMWSEHKKVDKKTAHEKAQEELSRYIGRAEKTSQALKVTPNNVRKAGHDKILTISDLHIPFHSKEKLAKIFVDEADCNILVIAGDLMNGDAMSDHIKVVHNDFRQELAETAAFLEECSKRFEKVFILDGNHDQDRYVRLLGKIPRQDVASWFYDTMNPLTQVKSSLPNVFRANETHNTKFADKIGHTLILGDCLWSHLTFSGRDGASVRLVKNWYEKWKDYFGWGRVRVFQQGHTHQLSLNFDFGDAVIQTGCQVEMDGLEYSLASHGRGSPPCWGYTVIEQVDGKTDLSTIRIVKQ